MMKEKAFLESDRIELKMVEEEDVDSRVQWINNIRVSGYTGFDYPVSRIGTKEWLSRVTVDRSRKDFTVFCKESSKRIGYAGLLNIDRNNLKAEEYFGIGDTDMWGEGYGSEVLETVVGYGFNCIGLNRIYGYTHEENVGSRKVHKKVGFEMEGRLKEDIKKGRKFYDRIIFGITRESVK